MKLNCSKDNVKQTQTGARRTVYLLGPRSERKLTGGEDILAAIVDHRGREDIWRDRGLQSFYNLHVETRGESFLRG